ncbi:MAG: thrombospondin type 3 repeat-containing protein [Patescibacteria group bacterium]
MRKFLNVTIFLISLCAVGVSAQQASNRARTELMNAYRQYKEVNNLVLSVPTVVEVSFADQYLERDNFAVLDQFAGSYEPSYVRQETIVAENSFSIATDKIIGGASRMIDGDTRTYAEFALPENAQGSARIMLKSSQPVVSSGLTLFLDDHVALPTSVGIRAVVNGSERIVVAERSINQPTIGFPRTEARDWIVTFTFAQPLRITELRLIPENAASTKIYNLRFLAQPQRTYRIYFDPDRNVNVPVGETGNLALNKDVLVLPLLSANANPLYRAADVDADGVIDTQDNCVEISNRDQRDINHNGRGDVCDDYDRDGLINSKDNCPENANRSQADTDGDGKGDACDAEESRITERNPWLPWAGIVFAALVVAVLLFITVRMPTDDKKPLQRK